MKTAIRKGNRTKGAVTMFLSLFLFAFGITSAYLAQEVKAVAETSNFSETYVMDDLQGMTIDGKAFDIADYSFNTKQETNVVQFVEYCYSYDPQKQDNYGLYVYVHNPKGLEYVESERNAITLRVGAESTNFEKYEMDLLSVCQETDYERLFYKYGVVLTDEQETSILNDLSSAARVYEVGEIELLEKGKTMTTAYGVSSVYTYSGYASGYGADETSESTLKIMRKDGETLTLDVHSTFYRPAGTNGKNDYTQDSLHSVYFAVPKAKEEKYGKMTAVHATWLNAVLAPALVTGNIDAYEAILPFVGKDMSEHNEDLNYMYLGAYRMTTATGMGSITNHSYGYAYNLLASWPGNWAFHEYYGEEISTLYGLYYAGSGTDSADTYTVSSANLASKMLASAQDYGGELVNGKYSPYIFESVDEQFTDVNISAEETYSLTSETISQNWWQKLWGDRTVNTTIFDGIKAIYAVQETDFLGTKEEVCRKLFISEGDYDDFKSYYADKAETHTVYLFRYRTSDYVAQEATLLKEGSFLWQETWEEVDTNAYFFKQAVDLDFDVIDITLSADEVETVLLVVASPIDVIHTPTPPIDTETDEKFVMPWWGWVLIGLAALFVIGLVIRPVLTGIKYVFLIVTCPVWGPIWLILKIVGWYRND